MVNSKFSGCNAAVKKWRYIPMFENLIEILKANPRKLMFPDGPDPLMR